MSETITQERLKEVLDYNPETGVFLWVYAAGNAPAGSEAGCLNADGYILIGIDGRSYLAHRLAVLYTDGYMPENTVDHIDRIPRHNWRLNLREASQQCQMRNRSMNKNNTSGINGVSWYKPAGKWCVKIAVDYQNKHIGYFDNILEAAYARYTAEQCLGFQDCDINSSAKQFIEKRAILNHWVAM